MSFFDAIGKLGRAAIGTALLPVDFMKDAVTLGGVSIGEESALIKRARKIAQNLEDGLEEIDEDE